MPHRPSPALTPEAARDTALAAFGLDGMDSAAQIDALLARLALAHSMATHDALTGVWQHAAILGQLDQAHARSMRDGRPLGLMKLRAHYFGDHQDPDQDPVGAQVLKAVAARLRDTLRGGDAIGRLGGNQFLCLLEGCDIESARQVAERCRLAVASLPVTVQHDGASLTLVKAHLALVMVHPNAEVMPEVILEQADTLLSQLSGEDGSPVGVSVLAPA